MLKDVVQSVSQLSFLGVAVVVAFLSVVAFVVRPASHESMKKAEYVAYLFFMAATCIVTFVALMSDNSRVQHLADWIFLAGTGIFMLTLIFEEVRKSHAASTRKNR